MHSLSRYPCADCGYGRHLARCSRAIPSAVCRDASSVPSGETQLPPIPASRNLTLGLTQRPFDAHSAAGRAENLRLKPAEVTLTPPGFSVLLGVTPSEAAEQMKKAFPKATGLHTQARTVGVSTAQAIREAGFDVIPDPTKKFPNHGRVVHPEGAAGFTDENLSKLSDAFTNAEGLR